MKREKAKDNNARFGTDEIFLTEAQLAEMLGYSQESIRKMRARGYVDAACTIPMLKHYRITPRAIRYKFSDYRAWAEQFRSGA